MDSSIVVDNDSELREFSLYGSPVGSVKEVSELQSDPEPLTIGSIRIMHSVSLKSMQGIEKYSSLVELNLSSNSIERMECLHNLTNLEVLNLSCNRIRVINCLDTLKSLKKLILSSNRITSLQNLSQLEGEDFSLRVLDLKDNKIPSLAELAHLNCLSKLEEVYLTMEDEINPTYQDINRYAAALAKLPIALNLQKIDGKPASVFFSMLERLPEKQKREARQNYPDKADDYEQEAEREDISDFSTAPRRQIHSRPLDSPPRTSKREADNRNYMNQSGQGHYSHAEAQSQRLYQQEIAELQRKLQQTLEEQKELFYKFECNEKFWSHKCQKLEDELLELSKENKGYQDKNAKLHNALTSKHQEIDDLSNTIAALKSKKDRKEDMIESLQNRVGDIMKENGECHKELSLRMEEMNRIRENLSDAETRIGELKAIIRENERNLTEIHTKAIENSNINILRSEELQRKYEGLHKNYEEKCQENLSLGQKNKELVDLVKDWELKFDNKIRDFESQRTESVGEVEREYIKKLEEANEKHRKEAHRQEENFKESMDLLEEEFKKVLLENNEKYKHIRIAFEEKSRTESELREFMKITVAKATEQERLIEEQNEILKRIRHEYMNTLQEKDEISRLLSDKNSTIKTSVNTYKEDLERLQRDKDSAQRLLKDLEDELSMKTRELTTFKRKLMELEAQCEDQEHVIKKLNDRLRDKDQRSVHELEDLAHELEDLKETMNTKNRMLEDKNAVIDQLKDQISAKDAEIQQIQKDSANKQAEDDLHHERRVNEKLRHKLDKLEEYVNELEENVNNFRLESENKDEETETLRNKVDMLKNQLSDKVRIVDTIETEMMGMVGQQQHEIKRQKERIEELEVLLEECRSTLLKRSEKIKSLEEQVRTRDSDIERLIKVKDREVDNLRRKNQKNEEEMKVLVMEIERQKTLAKEKIEKLHQIFQ